MYTIYINFIVNAGHLPEGWSMNLLYPYSNHRLETNNGERGGDSSRWICKQYWLGINTE